MLSLHSLLRRCPPPIRRFHSSASSRHFLGFVAGLSHSSDPIPPLSNPHLPSLPPPNTFSPAYPPPTPSPSTYPARLPHAMADPGILFSTGAATDHFPPASPSLPPRRRIIIAHNLPFRATPDPAAPSSWSFSYDHDALVLQLHSDLPASIDVLHVGTLRGLPDGLDLTHHDAIAAHIRREFRYIPVLIHRTSSAPTPSNPPPPPA